MGKEVADREEDRITAGQLGVRQDQDEDREGKGERVEEDRNWRELGRSRRKEGGARVRLCTRRVEGKVLRMASCKQRKKHQRVE